MMTESVDHPISEAASPDQRIRAPFPFVRYYLIASVLLALGALALLNFLSLKFERDSVVARLEQQAARSALPVANEISLGLGSLAGPGHSAVVMLAEVRPDLVDRLVVNSIRAEPIVRIDMVNEYGNLIYSTDDSAGLGTAIGPMVLLLLDPATLSSGPASHYVGRLDLKLFNGVAANPELVVTVVPLLGGFANEGEIYAPAYMVAYRDVTGPISAANPTPLSVRLGTAGATLLAMFGILLWVVIRGQRFTARARDELTLMLDREKSTTRQLHAANDTRARFLSMVSHELRTPLTSVVSFTNSLRSRFESGAGERDQRLFQALGRNADQLKMLIDDLLDVSAAEDNRLDVEMSEFELEESVTGVVESMRPVYDAKGQRMRTTVSLPPGMMYTGDRRRFAQVLTNLLSNASKYSPDGAEVRLYATLEGETVSLRVSDDGMGISDHDQAKLFKMFFRAENALESGIQGTGLGLVIVEAIIAAHGGEIKLESELGKGTVVTVRLPLEHCLGTTADEAGHAADRAA